MSDATAMDSIPQPRDGALGRWDTLVGPSAQRWENAGTLGFAAVGAISARAPLATVPARALRRRRVGFRRG